MDFFIFMWLVSKRTEIYRNVRKKGCIVRVKRVMTFLNVYEYIRNSCSPKARQTMQPPNMKINFLQLRTDTEKWGNSIIKENS